MSKSNFKASIFAALLALALGSCATRPEARLDSHARRTPSVAEPAVGDPYPSTYTPAASGDIALVNATILTAAGPRIERGRVIIRANKIAAIGPDVAIPDGARVIDAAGKWITPGIIDGHSHVGSVSIPYETLEDGLNELTDPNTAQIYIENALWAQSPEFPRARAAGVTTVLVLPGSGNIFGGHTVVLKDVPAVTVEGMKFPGAPYSIKMACGENPTRAYGPKGHAPMTRAGLYALIRAAFTSATEYSRQWDEYREKLSRGEKADPPKRDLQLEALAGILKGEIRIQMHCYRSDDMADMLDISHEFKFKVAAFHHATEAFKIIPLLKENGVCVLTWGGPDWGGFKMEALDHTALEAAMIERAGGCAALVSDSLPTEQHLNLDAARSMLAGNRAGLGITFEEAIRWITLNPAKAIGIDSQTGSLEVGKMADLVIWNRDPFSVYAYPERVLIDGVEVYRRGAPAYSRPSDFELGQVGQRHEQQRQEP
jgi:imidazolonepropionase-like amidohydrolase